ncbi:hypothetical protein KEM52_000676 [Ascosphaera acerosa]|nr:hypothetical protein KEM52_000676 [Ascosphaera acerosa]
MSSDQETPGAQPDLAAPIALPGPIEPIHDTSITPLETLSRYRVVPDEKDVQPGLSTIAATKRDMRAWLNKLKKPKKQVGASEEPSPITPVVRNDLIFGAPLATSISYASVPISVQDDTGAEFVYGIIPIVVAKCGKKLKAEAITTPGIFRVNGSNKRLSDLVDVFSHPGDYGKDFNWDGFTPHDAANLLRRYLNSLPEPVVPLDFYHRFREPLRRRSEWTLYHKLQAHADQPPLDLASTVIIYQNLIVDMPALNRQLLLYLLDMLAVFATSAKDNLMPANNLAAIFQPCILSHPQHVMIPPEYRLSQDVLIFLIENQDHFLFGMSRARPQSQYRSNQEGQRIRIS